MVFGQPEPDELMELTVIVPARNEEDCLGTCLKSLVAQSDDTFKLAGLAAERRWVLADVVRIKDQPPSLPVVYPEKLVDRCKVRRVTI